MKENTVATGGKEVLHTEPPDEGKMGRGAAACHKS